MEDMTQAATETRRPKKTSPIAVLVFGVIVALIGVMIVADLYVSGPLLVAGWILIGTGAVMTLYGLIAAAVELGVARAQQR